MPYKTKFRKVDTPKNAAEMEALGGDANSMRSLGAAQYREARVKVANMLHYGAMIFAGTETFMQRYYGGADSKSLNYMMDGFRRAARQAGDHETAQNLPEAIGQMKSRLQDRFQPKRE